jgi:hypothetical protein
MYITWIYTIFSIKLRPIHLGISRLAPVLEQSLDYTKRTLVTISSVVIREHHHHHNH